MHLLDGSIVPFFSNTCIVCMRANLVWKMASRISKCVLTWLCGQFGSEEQTVRYLGKILGQKLGVSGWS